MQECEERVTLLTERSSRLESAGRAAKSEAKVVMKELEDAREALAAARAGAEALSSRLGPLERECREAQKAQEDLRLILLLACFFLNFIILVCVSWYSVINMSVCARFIMLSGTVFSLFL